MESININVSYIKDGYGRITDKVHALTDIKSYGSSKHGIEGYVEYYDGDVDISNANIPLSIVTLTKQIAEDFSSGDLG